MLKLATEGHQVQQATMKQKLLCNFSHWRLDTAFSLLEVNGNSQRLKTLAKAGCSFSSEDFRENGNVVGCRERYAAFEREQERAGRNRADLCVLADAPGIWECTRKRPRARDGEAGRMHMRTTVPWGHSDSPQRHFWDIRVLRRVSPKTLARIKWGSKTPQEAHENVPIVHLEKRTDSKFRLLC